MSTVSFDPNPVPVTRTLVPGGPDVGLRVIVAVEDLAATPVPAHMDRTAATRTAIDPVLNVHLRTSCMLASSSTPASFGPLRLWFGPFAWEPNDVS